MKVAVPVNGNELKVVTRTGRAPYFAIYSLSKDSFSLIDIIENGHVHHDHHGPHHEGEGQHKHEQHSFDEQEVQDHKRDLGSLAHCNYILVRALGPNMGKALELCGVKSVQFSKDDGNEAEDLIKKFLKQRQE